MRTNKFMKNMVFAAGLAFGASSLTAGPIAQDWIEQQYKAKYGHNTSVEDARLRAEQGNTAYRAEGIQLVAPNWIEQHLKGKLGRNSPAEEARLREAQESAAFREEAPAAIAAPNWIEQHIKVKQGR